jgi:hypothetical protein
LRRRNSHDVVILALVRHNRLMGPLRPVDLDFTDSEDASAGPRRCGPSLQG